MEIDGAQQAADASDTDDRPAGAADVGGAAPAQATESDASYYTEDLPIAAYQPVVTRVTQPAADAGDEGDTEAPGSGAAEPAAGRPRQRGGRRGRQGAAERRRARRDDAAKR